MMTFIERSDVVGEIRIPFDPEKLAPDYGNGGKPTPLFNLFVAEVDASRPGKTWIEDPDGLIAYEKRSD